MNSAPPFGVSMYPVPTVATASTDVGVATDPIAITAGADVEVIPEGIMDIDITNPVAVE